MANSSKVRAWAAAHTDENGKPYALAHSRGRLSFNAIKAFNAAHPNDTYNVSENIPPSQLYTPRVVSVKTFKSGTSKTGKAYRVPVTKSVNLADFRTWAASHGHKVGTRGRVSRDLLADYADTV